ncbi:MAG: FMN-binding protein [Candidatus Margulisiibacteriota bacterium]
MLAAGISGALLFGAHKLTQPLIEANQLKIDQAAAKKVGGQTRQVTVKGYAGDIKLLVGIDPSGNVTGVQVLAMQETPGLGTEAKKESFLNQFIKRSLKDKFRTKEDIVAITGATITSQAVSDGVRKALQEALPTLNITGNVKIQ